MGKPHAIVLAFLFAGAACGSSEPKPQPVSSQSPEWTDEQVAAEPEPQPVSPPARDARCMGTDLKLDELARLGVCDATSVAEALPAEVQLRLVDREVQVVQGQATQITLELLNSGAQPVELFLDHSCGLANIISTTFYSPNKVRLDKVGRSDCTVPRACGGHTVHVSLAAGARAELPVPVVASVTVVGEDCDELPGRPLSPGRYQVDVHAFARETPLPFAMNVQRLERLKPKDCAGYAAKVAAKAEPNAALVGRVAKTLETTCRASPPSRGFADCQLGAADEAALAACQEVPLP